MVIEVGEYFKKEFSRELENWTTWVGCTPEENANTHLRWSEPVGSFGLSHASRGPPHLTSVLVASLSWVVHKKSYRYQRRNVSSSGLDRDGSSG